MRLHLLPWVHYLEMHHLPRLRYVDVCGDRYLLPGQLLARRATYHHVQALRLRIREIEQSSFVFTLRLH